MTIGDRASHLGNASLLRAMADNWWLLLLRGIAAILFGVLAFVWPGITLITLTFMWGAYALVDGAVSLWAAIVGKGGGLAPRWWLAVVGVAGILAGLVAFLSPGITAIVLLTFIAAWAIVIGVFEIVGAVRLRKEIEGEWLLALSGVLAILFGVALIAVPGAGLLSLVWLIGAFAIVAGVSYIGLALRLKKHRDAG
jgi:uncharacterized membrane protein HdeD (DUF308 family)